MEGLRRSLPASLTCSVKWAGAYALQCGEVRAGSSAEPGPSLPLHLVPLPQGADPPAVAPVCVCGGGGAVRASRHSLAQRAGEAAIRGATAQAAGAKVVEAVQQAGSLELCVAQRAHQRVAARRVQRTQALQGREDSSRHLLGELRKAAGRARCGDPAADPAPVPASPRVPLGLRAAPSSLPDPDPTGRPAVVERWGWERWEQGEPAGGVRRGPVRGPLFSRTPLAALEGQAAVRPTQGLASPASTLPTSPHSHPRNSPPGVLWVTCRRHPFLAGPQYYSGAALPSTLPRPVPAPRRRAPAAATPRVAPRAEAGTPRLERTAWGEGPRLTGSRPG